MIVLGIDPGLNATGYGVIATEEGRLRMLEAGAICPPSNRPLAQRLRILHDGLARVMDAQHPTTVVLEALYTHHQYVTTASLMAHARGVACLAAAQHGLEVVDYLPTRVKKALTGSGAASKDQVARMVGMWLETDPRGWSADATDALALAIAHVHIHEHHAVPAGAAR